MGLLDDNLIESAFDEKEMRKNYRANWLKKHSCLGLPGIERHFPGLSAVRVNINENPKDSTTPPNWPQSKYIFIPKCIVVYELDSYLKDSDGNIHDEVARINTLNIINIKPQPNRPNHKYIIANVTDSDLSQFELRTRNGQGGVLYCINCTRNIVHKNHKWEYKFLEYDTSIDAYSIVEWSEDKIYKNKRMEASFDTNSRQSWKYRNK